MCLVGYHRRPKQRTHNNNPPRPSSHPIVGGTTSPPRQIISTPQQMGGMQGRRTSLRATLEGGPLASRPCTRESCSKSWNVGTLGGLTVPALATASYSFATQHHRAGSSVTLILPASLSFPHLVGRNSTAAYVIMGGGLCNSLHSAVC